MKFLSRQIVMPNDLNSRSSLFGGRLMAWIDEETSVGAAVEDGRGVVAIGMEITGKSPMSIAPRCSVRELRTKRDRVKIDQKIFIAIDKSKRAMRYPCTPDLRQEEAP